MQIIVFEDEHISRLYPIAIGRPAYAISCASFRLIDWLVRLAGELQCGLAGVVRTHLKVLQTLDFPHLAQEIKTEPPLLLVNARLVPSVANYRELKRLVAGHETVAIQENGSVA